MINGLLLPLTRSGRGQWSLAQEFVRALFELENAIRSSLINTVPMGLGSLPQRHAKCQHWARHIPHEGQNMRRMLLRANQKSLGQFVVLRMPQSLEMDICFWLHPPKNGARSKDSVKPADFLMRYHQARKGADAKQFPRVQW